MVLCLAVDCPAEVHFNTISALRNGKIFEDRGGSPPYPLKFRPCLRGKDEGDSHLSPSI